MAILAIFDQALPTGLFFLGVLLARSFLKKSGHRRSRAEYPSLAAELGLTFRPSPYRTGIGSLVGEREDFKIVVDPDEQRSILVRLKSGRFPVVLLSYEDHRLRSPELSPFRFSSVALRRWIKTARGDAGGAALAKSPKVLASLEELSVIRALKRLALEGDSLRIEFDYGSPPYLPPEMVRRVLPIAERLCRELGRGAEEGSEPPVSPIDGRKE